MPACPSSSCQQSPPTASLTASLTAPPTTPTCTALKKGYIDDVEFAKATDGTIMVRSASRVGQTDFAVNAKRLNYIAATLRKQGWAIDEITPKTHPDYFYAAADAADQTFDEDRRKGTDMENGRMERPTVG